MTNLLLTLLAGLFFLVGSFIALKIKDTKNMICFCIGMSFSVLIVLLLTDIFPECLELFPDYTFSCIFGGVLVGIGILLLLEKAVPHHDHFKEKKHHENHLNHIGVMTSTALVIHNIVEGIGIYGIASTGLKAGLIYAVGVGMHNIPFGASITAMFDHNDKKKMWTSIMLLTLSTFIGGLMVFIFSSLLTDFVLGVLLSITMGMIIYLLFGELFVELKENYNKYSVYGLIVGLLIMAIGMVI